MASLSELQKSVDAFTRKHNLLTSTDMRLLDLTSEVGELCKSHLKHTNYGRWKKHDELPFHRSDELGDVLYSLICIANQDDVDLELALNRALKKYGDRIDKRGNPGSGR